MEKPRLTVAIIACNEEDRIPSVLDAVSSLASEIVVVDSGSTDRTVELCRQRGVKVFHHEWEGFTRQKNLLLQYCTGDWILYLDADEVITEELRLEISESISQSNLSGFYINRKTFYLGRTLNHAWQPNYRLRLVRKDSHPLWIGGMVHERLTIEGKTGHLQQALIHYSYRNISDHMMRTVKYAELSAADYASRGKRSSILKLIYKPFFAFLRAFFLKKGLLDGFPGFIASCSSSFYVFLEYANLYAMERQKEDE